MQKEESKYLGPGLTDESAALIGGEARTAQVGKSANHLHWLVRGVKLWPFSFAYCLGWQPLRDGVRTSALAV